MIGSMPVRDHAVRQWRHAPVREHSRKPDEFITDLDRLFGDVPRVELFARTERPGWDVWGNQVGRFTGDYLERAPDGDVGVAA